MKTKTFILIAAIGLMLSGCLVKSIHPFYFAKDVIYDPSLTGSWLDADSSLWVIEQWTTSFIGPEKPTDSYKITFTEKHEQKAEFEVHLFMLGGQKYVDFVPMDIDVPDLTGFHLVKAHSIARIETAADSISIKWFNESWLTGLFEENRIRIAHETLNDDADTKSYILTARTEELQKFIIKYGNDPNAFKDNFDEEKDDDEKDEILCYSLTRIKE